jgi:hypothetical protein
MQFDRLKQRDFITLIGGAVVWPLAARAQQRERMRRIGVLQNLAADDAMAQARHGALLQGLQQAGWAIGRNVQVETRWAAGDADRLRTSSLTAASFRMGLIFSTSTGARPAMSTAFSKARKPPTFPSRHQPSTSWRSTSRPRRRSASTFQRPCSPAPTRSSNETARVHRGARRRRGQQPEPMRRVGVLMSVEENNPDGKTQLSRFTEGLEEMVGP